MIDEPEMNSEGIIKTSPVTDYGTRPVFGTAILLQVEYVNSEQELQTGKRHQIPLLLTRQGALDLRPYCKNPCNVFKTRSLIYQFTNHFLIPK